MANPVIRMVAFYFNDKKAATVNSVGYDIDPKRTPAFGQEGLLAHAKGAVMTGFDIGEVTPVAGSSFTGLIADILAQNDIDCAVLIGGKTHRIKMACTKVSFKSVSETGMSDGSMTLAGGVPKVV